MLLDEHHFNEASLKAAWRNATNQGIAASIIGNIRQAALAEALLPFEQRVAQAIQCIYVMQSWAPVQRRWLECLAK
ncbi:type I restriction-modification enzyme R subunit C-terminal domain-containing protein [Chitinolyticbacter meiyuanensis]|uniref:type I restriction-modification enzyme R subunit C-terminal domain-containing protein n=1 Tax=Chitinolyticbacter meiyuanensis TaxID=682798 RepID=UPI001C9E98C0|nr:type I restriction-modification enzyme R subunit C-terminal domain-containing protein [Chitinolyticbacter meiyuanensis]